jgi:hypothetical protein
MTRELNTIIKQWQKEIATHVMREIRREKVAERNEIEKWLEMERRNK